MNLKNSQCGVSIYLAIVIMFVLLGIGLGISTLLVGQIRMIRGMGYSVVAFYAADTGIERELKEKNPTGITYSGYLDLDNSGGQNDEDSSYTVKVSGPGDDDCPDLPQVDKCIQSLGVYKGTRRAIEITIPVLPITVVLDYNDALDWAWSDGTTKEDRFVATVLYVSTGGKISLIKWDLSGSLPGGHDLPNGAVIESATFYFYDTWFAGGGGGSGTIYLKSVDNDSWDSTITSASDLYDWLPNEPEIATFTDVPIGWKSADITLEVENANNPADDILSLKWEYINNAPEGYDSPISPTIDQRLYIVVIYYP